MSLNWRQRRHETFVPKKILYKNGILVFLMLSPQKSLWCLWWGPDGQHFLFSQHAQKGNITYSCSESTGKVVVATLTFEGSLRLQIVWKLSCLEFSQSTTEITFRLDAGHKIGLCMRTLIGQYARRFSLSRNSPDRKQSPLGAAVVPGPDNLSLGWILAWNWRSYPIGCMDLLFVIYVLSYGVCF